MTQCTKTPENQEEYCKMCAKTMDATTGKPKFGSMHDRDKEGWTDPSGKSPLHYVTVMTKNQTGWSSSHRRTSERGSN